MANVGNYQEIQDEDIAKAAKRKVDIEKSQKELMKWNVAILKEKEAQNEFERREEEMILAYQEQGDLALRKKDKEEIVRQLKKEIV